MTCTRGPYPFLRGGRRLDECLDELVLRGNDNRFLLQLLVRGVQGVLQFLLMRDGGVFLGGNFLELGHREERRFDAASFPRASIRSRRVAATAWGPVRHRRAAYQFAIDATPRAVILEEKDVFIKTLIQTPKGKQ